MLDISGFQPMLKKYYTPRNVELVTYKKFPTLRLLPKRTDWTGSTYDMPIWYESAQSVGHNFADAKAGKDRGQYDKWSLTQSKIYGFAQLDRQVMKRSMGDKRAFLKAFTAEVDGVLQLLGREMAGKIFGNRAGVRSTIRAIENADGTNDAIVLANRQDVVHFSVGMALVASQAGTSATLRNSGAPLYVRKIDRTKGVLLISNTRYGSPYDITTDSWDVGDSLHRFGDITTASDQLGFAGFGEWLDENPTSTPFFGVDRTIDRDKLAGMFVDGAGLTIEDALIEGGMRAFEAGADLTHFVMNPLRIGQLIRALGSKVIRDEKTSAKIGKSAFLVQTPAGEQSVYGDPFCPPNRIYGLNIKTWELVSTGPLPELFDDDLKMLREADADAYEVRMGGYGQLGCHVPGENLVITLE